MPHSKTNDPIAESQVLVEMSLAELARFRQSLERTKALAQRTKAQVVAAQEMANRLTSAKF